MRTKNRSIPEDELRERIAYAKSVNWDHEKCAEKWDMTYNAVTCFKFRYTRGLIKVSLQKEKEGEQQDKPEYENQDLLDLCVLERDEYCTKYGCTAAAYYTRCRHYKGHKDIPTPKVRRRWAIELEKEAE